jgi:hypothetical protein
MKTILTLLLIVNYSTSSVSSLVYKALKGESVETIDSVLSSLDKENASATKNAYTGVLLMKKAGLINGPFKKIEMFKQGHKLLEAEIAGDLQNTEYRFLRLTIQENAPKILGYDQNIEEDILFISTHFSSLKSELKVNIQDYATRSNILNKTDLRD